MKRNFTTAKKYFPKWIMTIKSMFNKINIPSKIIFFVLGILSTIWFIIRVIPKPSRATYPCMKAAAPFMSAFIIYLLTLSASFFAFHKAKIKFIQTKYLAGGLFIIAGLVSGGLFISQKIKTIRANVNNTNDLTANTPMGTALGVNPGRVVWAWDPNATNENCTNSYGSLSDLNDDDGYFLPKNNDQKVIDYMMDSVVMDLANGSNIKQAWDSLFIYFNNKKYSSKTTYVSGQTIFVKINTTSAGWLADEVNDADLSFFPLESWETGWKPANYGISETSPQIILSTLRQLIDSVGIPQDKIYVGDPISHIWKSMYEYLHNIYPDVKYVDNMDFTSIGRTTLTPSTSDDITYSDAGSVMSSAVTDKLYQEMVDADYLINLAVLKAHARAGITLCAKNHFGSHTRTGADHLHPGLVAPNGTSPTRNAYGLYRVQVDIMGDDYLGGNTVLFVVDGLWGGAHDTKQPVKWQMSPFNNDWSNSIFVSLDQVAIESVCFDFLRTEFDGSFTYPEISATSNYPNMGGVDDYLEQAADPTNWPVGITYSPSGTTLTSLGTHEHWNDATNKQYSRDLASGNGIELFKLLDLPTPDASWYNYIEDTTSLPVDTSGTGYNINNAKLLKELTIYPIPANNQLNIRLENNYSGNIIISIIDVSGKQLMSNTFTKKLGYFEQTIDISNLQTNMYVLRIKADNYSIAKQFYKTN